MITFSAEPIACSLSAKRFAARREELANGLLARAREIRELPSGYVLTFGDDVDIDDAVRDFIDFERRCCGFLELATTRREGEGTVELSITGPAGTKETLRGWMRQPAPARSLAAGSRRLPRASLAGAVGAIVALVCCATPVLGWILAAVGLGASAAAIAGWVDRVAIAVFALSIAGAAIAAARHEASRSRSP